MDLPQLVDAVKVKTGRPDQGDGILLALREATIWAHLSDFWLRDLVEVPIEYDPPQYKGSHITRDILPGFRKLSYWRKWDPISGQTGDYLTEVTPDKLFDAYKCRKTNVYYLGGAVLNWNSSTNDKGHVIGYWRTPDISINNYTSWIAELQPFVLVNYASSIIFGDIGQDDEAKKKMAMAIEGLHLVRINDVEAAGR